MKFLLLGSGLLALAALAGFGAEAEGEHRLVRGVTISCQTNGWEWGQEAFGDELVELRELGANWVAIHPYARIGADGEVRHRLDPGAPPRWLTHPVRVAREKGMAILIKPHLAYWGSPFRWRGDIHFEDPEARARFWESYADWIATLADIVAEADAFCVGTELDRMVAEPGPWRTVIARVRERTDALLTYAANWDTFEGVAFWDALDAVGLQAYFPLTEAEDPDEAELEAGWANILPRLTALHQRTGKPVVFTELGYNRSLSAARRPWDDARAGPDERDRAAELQARCLRVALRTIEREAEWLRGAFLWKWFVGDPDRYDGSFLMDTPHMRAAMVDVWGR